MRWNALLAAAVLCHVGACLPDGQEDAANVLAQTQADMSENQEEADDAVDRRGHPTLSISSSAR